MSEGLFRKNSLDKIASPEQVNDYIKTSNPSIWVIFAVASLLLIGVAVWGVFGTIDITVGAVTVCEDNKAVCYISESDIERISDSALVRINEESYTITDISQIPEPAEEKLSPYGMHLAGIDETEWVYSAAVKGDMKEGIYKAEIVIESISPVSLLMN